MYYEYNQLCKQSTVIDMENWNNAYINIETECRVLTLKWLYNDYSAKIV